MSIFRSRSGLTRPRVASLVLMALLATGLVVLRFAPDSGSVALPERAKAGDLTMHRCDYATEDGSQAADCGTLVVPQTRTDPQSRLLALPVIRLRAQSDQAADPVFYLEGGPGITNVAFTQASRYTPDRDVVLVGYRGVDGSVRLDCPEVTSALAHSTDFLSDTSFRAYGDAFRSCAERLSDDGLDLSSYGLPQQVEDLEAARTALGYDRVNLLSQSAGTRTAMIYAWRYPERIHRSIMIGVNPPGHFLWETQAADEQLRRYADLCANDASCSKRTDDLTAEMRRTAADLPHRWLFLPINESNVRVYSFFGLMESSSEAPPPSAPMTLDSWLSAAEGDPSGFWLLSLAADLLPIPFVWGQYASASGLDAEAARDYFSTDGQDPTNFGWVGSAFAWGGGRLADDWPAVPEGGAYSRVRTSEVETLLIGGALDSSTPPQVATNELLPHLPHGRQVILPGFGHTASFFAEQREAGTRLINTFFATGQVDDSVYKPQGVDLTPARTLPTTAKFVAGAMTGLALLTILALLWIWQRVHVRGSLGRRTSAAVRTAAPIVIGLGGWFAGLLFVLVAFPAVPLYSRLLAAVSIGVPISLAVYGAWLHRDWAARTKMTGLAAAAATAVIGAWLGYGAADGLFAVVTTIVGAAVGANLALIVLDLIGERSGRGQATRLPFLT